MAGGLVTRGDQQHAAVFHPLDLAVEQPEFRRVALVVSRVNGQQCRLDSLQTRGGVVVARRVPLVQVVVGITAKRRAQALVEQLVGLLACRRLLVESLVPAVGGDAVEDGGETAANLRWAAKCVTNSLSIPERQKGGSIRGVPEVGNWKPT